MEPPRHGWTEERVEATVAALLRTGVRISAAIVLAGAMVYLARHGRERPHYQVFAGEPTDLRTVRGVVGDAASLSGRGLIQLGLLVLVMTPVARVALSLAAFGLQRDWTYVAVTALVLLLLLGSLAGRVP